MVDRILVSALAPGLPANPRRVKLDTWRNRWGEGVQLIASGLGLGVA